MGLVDQQVLANIHKMLQDKQSLRDFLSRGDRIKIPIPPPVDVFHRELPEATRFDDEFTFDFNEVREQMNRAFDKRIQAERYHEYGKLKYLANCLVTGKNPMESMGPVHILEQDSTDGCEICGCEDCVEGFMEWPRKHDRPEQYVPVYNVRYSARCDDHRLQEYERAMVGSPESPYVREI